MGNANVASIMDNKLTLDLADPAIADALKHCKVGEQETLTLTVTPTDIVSGDSISFTVDDVEYSEPPAAEPSDEEDVVEPAPKPKKKVPPAVGMVSGSKE